MQRMQSDLIGDIETKIVGRRMLRVVCEIARQLGYSRHDPSFSKRLLHFRLSIILKHNLFIPCLKKQDIIFNKAKFEFQFLRLYHIT